MFCSRCKAQFSADQLDAFDTKPLCIQGSPIPFLLVLGTITIFSGCKIPNTHVDLVHMPAQASSPDLTSAQEKSVALTLDQAFAKSLDALMDMGFQVRSANRDSGQVNIFRVWDDPSGSKLSVEATLLFRPEGVGTTKIRMLAMGNWQFISIGSSNSSFSDVSGITNLNDPAGYRAFLEKLTSAITH